MASSLRTLWAAALVLAAMLSAAHAQDEAEWLAAHNAARSAVGVGPLVWNTSAAAYALDWVQTQTARADCPTLEHSSTEVYGENLAYMGAADSSPTTVTAMWVSEIQWYDYATNGCSAPEGESCGHYTQVVWSSTTSIGCASAPCAQDATYVYSSCNYYPPGNYVGEKPY